MTNRKNIGAFQNPKGADSFLSFTRLQPVIWVNRRAAMANFQMVTVTLFVAGCCNDISGIDDCADRVLDVDHLGIKTVILAAVINNDQISVPLERG